MNKKEEKKTPKDKYKSENKIPVGTKLSPPKKFFFKNKNFNGENYQSEKEEKKLILFRFLKKFLIIFLFFLIVLGIFLAVGTYFWSRPFPGRTNFLILGIAGKGHAGGDLTDTNIFLSVDHQTGKTLLLSLPRDIWIKELRAKLNTIYHYQGLSGNKKIVGEILGQSVNYVLVINFDVFTELIDVLGGIEVEVERAFDDYRYPISGKENDLCDGDPEFQCRYEHLHFDSGKQLMNGKRALKYVRSRYADGEEGTDFARSQRQQKLILAVKNKLLSFQVISHPKLLIQLIKVAFSSVETDIPPTAYSDLLRIILRFKSENLRLEVLNGERLINPPASQKLYDGQWVLVPKSGNWQEIQEYVKQLVFN